MARLQCAENIATVLDHLGIEKAHFAARLDTDWTRYVVMRPNSLASMTLVCPSTGFDIEAVRPLGGRLMVIADDQATGQKDRNSAAALPEATLVTLSDYSGMVWSDVVADRPSEVMAAISDITSRFPLDAAELSKSVGSINGVSYSVEGAGPPLVLLPLVLAPSQWEPILPELRERFTLITLGAAHVGFVPVLESRAQTGYLNTVKSVVEQMQIDEGDCVLEVGCGTGVLSRWLARFTSGACPISALDQNTYLLREATALAKEEGLADIIDFREGDAAALPFDKATFDATICFTVLEEVDADAVLAEMIRVTKPGGSIGVIVRAVDRPWQVNLDVIDAIRAKAEAPKGSIGAGSCADMSLYDRVRRTGLTDLKLYPHMAALTGPMGYYYLDRVEGTLTPQERVEWQSALADAEANGTLFFAQPFHCAIGTKPF